MTSAKTGYAFSPASASVTVSGANVTVETFAAIAPANAYSLSGTVSGNGFAGVAVSLTGTATGSKFTDANGHYAFTGLKNGNYTVTPAKTGYSFSPASASVTVSAGLTALGNSLLLVGTASGPVDFGDGYSMPPGDERKGFIVVVAQ